MNTAQFTDISVSLNNRVVKKSINRPEKLNAIRIATDRELITALELGDEEPECTVIQLDGAGPHFSAGNDLSDLIGERLHEVLACIRDLFTTVSPCARRVYGHRCQGWCFNI